MLEITKPISGQAKKRRGRRRGRSRKKNVRRDGHGNIKKPTVAEKAKLLAKALEEAAVKAIVLAQPHRCGSDDRLMESALGRTIIKHGADRRLWATGANYGELSRKWSAAIGAPMALMQANHLVCGKKTKYRSAQFWETEKYSSELKQNYSVTDYSPLVQPAAARARKAERMFAEDNRKLQRLRKPLDRANDIIQRACTGERRDDSAGEVRRQCERGTAGLNSVRRLCVDERPLECLEDEVAALRGLSALHRSGMRLMPDSLAIDVSDGHGGDDAMTLYEIHLGILRAAFGIGRVKR